MKVYIAVGHGRKKDGTYDPGAGSADGKWYEQSAGDIVVKAAVKPISSIPREQQTVDLAGKPRTIKVAGRHDLSAIPRIVPVLAAMVRLTLADFLLRQRAGQ